MLSPSSLLRAEAEGGGRREEGGGRREEGGGRREEEGGGRRGCSGDGKHRERFHRCETNHAGTTHTTAYTFVLVCISEVTTTVIVRKPGKTWYVLWRNIFFNLAHRGEKSRGRGWEEGGGGGRRREGGRAVSSDLLLGGVQGT